MAVLNGAVARQEQDESVHSLVFSHLQYLSLIAYEVRRFTERATDSVDPWEHEPALAASRHSTKLFNDTKKTHLELLAEFTDRAAGDRAWYLQNNRAPWLAHALARLGFPIYDTSVTLYDDQILCTSQSIRFHAQLGPGADQAETVERATELASYLSGLCRADGEDWIEDDYFRRWRPDVVVSKDARYENLYPAMFPAVPVAEGIALSVLQSDLFALKLMREIVPDSDPLAPATFKFRFTGVWQVIETLRAIVATGSELSLTESMRGDLETLLASEPMAPMRTKNARNLRNVLTHYGLGSLKPANLDWRDPLLGLPDLLLEGRDWREADQMVSDQIAAVLKLLATWTGPFEHTLAEPH